MSNLDGDESKTYEKCLAKFFFVSLLHVLVVFIHIFIVICNDTYICMYRISICMCIFTESHSNLYCLSRITILYFLNPMRKCRYKTYSTNWCRYEKSDYLSFANQNYHFWY